MNENAVFSVNCNLCVTYMIRLCATLLLSRLSTALLCHCTVERHHFFKGMQFLNLEIKNYTTALKHCFSFLVSLCIYSKCFQFKFLYFLLKGNHFCVFALIILYFIISYTVLSPVSGSQLRLSWFPHKT